MRITRVVASTMVGGATIALLAAQLASAAPAAPAADAVLPGSAFSSAGVTTVGPSYGGLAITVTAGYASAYYQGTSAQATSQAVNAASLSGLTGAGGGGALGGVDADSTKGAATKTGGGPLVGTEAVTVTSSPESARATTHAAVVEIPGLLKVDGQSSAGVAYTAGQRQAADAGVTMDLELMGGAVALDALQWHADISSGDRATSTTSFTIGRLTLDGRALPTTTPAQLGSSIATVNQALATVGLTLYLPSASTDPTTGTVTMSPLELRLARATLTNQLLGPLLDPASKVELALADALQKGGQSLGSVSSTIGTAALVGGLVLGILAGAGKVSLALGGVSASVQDPPGFTDPLGGTALGPSSGGVVTPPALGPTAYLSASPLPLTATPVAPTSSGVLGAGTSRCTTTSPAGRPGCSRGAATVAASVLLFAGLALFTTDLVASRRRRVPLEGVR